MTFKLNSAFLWKLFALAFVLMGIGAAVSLVGAAEPLPERPIVPITTSSTQNGSKIVLKAPIAADNNNNRVYDANDWTVVQWQAVNGSWYDVVGWQGTFAYNANVDIDNWRVEWWVDSENYGEENFRYLIYSNDSKEQLKQTSPIFNMPKNRHEIVEVTLD